MSNKKVSYEFVRKSDADNAKDTLLEKMYRVRTNRKSTLGGPQVETTLLDMYWSSDYVGMRALIQSLTGDGGATRNACIRCLDTIISYEAGRKKAVYSLCKKNETTPVPTQQVQKAVETPKKEYLPRTAEYWMDCTFGVNIPTLRGYGYFWETCPMDKLPENLQNFPYNEKFTVKEFHQYVGEHFDAYAKAGKLRTAFENLKARIDLYNEGVREDATDIHKAVERADALLGYIIQEQRKNLQRQIRELRAACIKIGVKPRLIESLLEHAEEYTRLRNKVLLKAEDLELELPAIDAPTLEAWMVPQLAGYTPYDVYSNEMPTKYTDEERKAAPKTNRVIRWTQDITKALTPQREDLLILMTLYITQADGNTELFYRHDKFGDKIERDMRPAPTTDEEIREWKAFYEEEENKKWNTPIEWVSK